MLKKQRKSPLKNEDGMAIFEMIPIIMIIMLLVNFSLGFFGAIHTGIVNSIAARNYAFETFRNRSNLAYFKNTGNNVDTYYTDLGMRMHGSISEGRSQSSKWTASARTIDFVNFDRRAADLVGTDQANHKKVREVADAARNTAVGVNPIWIKTSYGICLYAGCEKL